MKSEEISLRDYINIQLKSNKEYSEARFAAIEKATTLSRENIEIRLNGMNEWRQTYGDQQANFITRSEFEEIKKIVYIGVGMSIVIEVILKFFIK
jgi:hypothetical protein